MSLPKKRDPRFITIRRGGALTDADHRLLALWAASCAEHVLPLFESVRPDDPRPRQAIEKARAWVRGELLMSGSRASAGAANSAARDLSGAPRHAAYAAAQAAAVAHVAYVNETPYLAFRSLSDLAGGGPGENELTTFFELASSNSAALLMSFLTLWAEQ